MKLKTMKPKTMKLKEDLTPKSTDKVTGGGRRLNDNLTFLRG